MSVSTSSSQATRWSTSLCNHLNAHFLSSGILSQLWDTLNVVTSLILLSLISVNVPGAANKVNSPLISFSQFNILPTDWLFNQVFKFDFDDSQAHSLQLGTLGYQSTNAILNMGSALVYIVVLSLVPGLLWFIRKVNM